jgi:hypothetical protein
MLRPVTTADYVAAEQSPDSHAGSRRCSSSVLTVVPVRRRGPEDVRTTSQLH